MPNMQIECICGGPFETNAYLVADTQTRRCAIVDPGYGADHDWGIVMRENGLELESILLTHGHIDHTTGVACLARAHPGIPIYIHPDDASMLTADNVRVAQMLGLPPFETAEPTHLLADGVPVRVGGLEFQVIHVPGHTPGHVAFLRGDTLISGDVLFLGSIGRTDLPGGNFKTLAHSIVKRLLPLGDKVQVLPGHGPVTTIGHERESNPFVEQMLEMFPS